MQHKSGKEYDPTAWAAQRRAAVEAANKLRLERKTGAGEANDLTFSPELVARNPKLNPSMNVNGLPVEMDQHSGQKGPYHQHNTQYQQPYHQQSPHQQQQQRSQANNSQGRPVVSTSLDQLATDSLDHFYAAEGSRIAGPGSDPLTATPPGKENFVGGRGGSGMNAGYIQGQQLFVNGQQNLSPTSDSLVQELRRQGGGSSVAQQQHHHHHYGQQQHSGDMMHENVMTTKNARGSSPFVSKFGQELYQEGLRGIHIYILS
jgi:hypothetical protein